MLKHPHLEELRAAIRDKKDRISSQRESWVRRNTYYYEELAKHLSYIISPKSRILHIGCSTGFILEKLDPSFAVGIEDSPLQIELAQKKRIPNTMFVSQSLEAFTLDVAEPFEFVLISALEDVVDVKAVLSCVRLYISRETRIILTNYNYLWNPLVKLAEKFSLKYPQNLHNWISSNDVADFITLAGFERVTDRNVIIFPFYIPLISVFLNKYLARLPLFRMLPLIQITVSRPKMFDAGRARSVSVIIPCRNEVGNIENAVSRMPALGSHTEIIFCDDKSTDGTPGKVREMMEKYPEKDIKLVDGPGICKAQNVWTGFTHASGDILMILDADLTVIPEELPYFYEAIAMDYGEFINGSRLVYPMQQDAMRFFNVIGNKFFSIMFSYILGTKLKDTLCGTKVMWRSDYERFIKPLRGSWGLDRWCDYDLIFGAAKSHRQIIELPVHYMDRTYGETKMTNRIKNGIVMLKMTMRSLIRIKFA